MAVTKRALKAGEMLDGEGGYTVYAKLIPAERGLKLNALPIGLAHHVKLNRDVAAGEFLSAADVALDYPSQAVRIRREMERQCGQADRQSNGRGIVRYSVQIRDRGVDAQQFRNGCRIAPAEAAFGSDGEILGVFLRRGEPLFSPFDAVGIVHEAEA